MTNTDPFEHDDAAYVLGALSDAEHRAFQAHLSTCDACTARVQALADLPDLLAAVSVTALEPAEPPEALLPGLLRRAGAERRRRHWLTGGLAALAAACLIALLVAVWPADSGRSGPPPQAMAAVVVSQVHATATLTGKSWGTEIDLACSYDGTAPAGYVYGLTVTGMDGTRYELGSWTLVAGQDTVFTSGVALDRSQIRTVEITAGTQPILRLTT